MPASSDKKFSRYAVTFCNESRLRGTEEFEMTDCTITEIRRHGRRRRLVVVGQR